MNIIDYSQTRLFQECPLKWYERYIQRRVRRPSTGQRDDAMAIGSLVHSGIENWYTRKSPTIADDVIEEVGPTPDAYTLSEALVLAYTNYYCNEPWELVAVEEPITMPLGVSDYSLMAKVDAYFYCDREMDLETNDPSHTIRLTRGYWGLEHKTKDPGINRANWMQSWESNLQASFQTLALNHKLGEPIQGIIVNVIEKPRQYTPMRKCKGCGEQYELGAYLSAGEGQAACPVCGYLQVVKPYVPKKSPEPSFFRLKVQRTEDQLAYHLRVIRDIALKMQIYQEVPTLIIPTLEACVHRIFGPCEYWRNHTYGISTTDDPNMMDKDTSKYMGLTILA